MEPTVAEVDAASRVPMGDPAGSSLERVSGEGAAGGRAGETGLRIAPDRSLTDVDGALSPAALRALSDFGERHGYGRQTLVIKADGTLDLDALSPDPHGLAVFDEAQLRARAANGDMNAQHALAQRLLARGNWEAGETLREAAALLTTSAARGSTASINALAQLEQNLLVVRGKDEARQHAIEAHAWLMASERRGDLEAAGDRIALAGAHPLDAQMTREATQRAVELYDELARTRHALGLHPFDDEVPDEIRATFAAYTVVVDRMMEPVMRQMKESERQERARIDQLRAEAAARGEPWP